VIFHAWPTVHFCGGRPEADNETDPTNQSVTAGVSAEDGLDYCPTAC